MKNTRKINPNPWKQFKGVLLYSRNIIASFTHESLTLRGSHSDSSFSRSVFSRFLPTQPFSFEELLILFDEIIAGITGGSHLSYAWREYIL